MISCPPYSHLENHPEVPYPHKTMNLPSGELMKLFQLSQSLPLEGEITPVIALNMIWNHPRFSELTAEDFNKLREELRMKTRCYGYALQYNSSCSLNFSASIVCLVMLADNAVFRFGAVLEEFELQDALNNVFATKFESNASYG